MQVAWVFAQFLERIWWQRYLSKRSVEGYLQWKKDYWLRFLDLLEISLDELKGKRILDLGCGPAGINIVLNQSYVTGVDSLIFNYGKDLSVFEPHKHPHVQYVNQSLETYDPERPVEVVFCTNAINHVANIHTCLHRMAHSLEHRGTFVISTDVHRYSWIARVCKTIPLDWLHPQQLREGELEILLADVALMVQRKVRLRVGKVFDYWAFVGIKT